MLVGRLYKFFKKKSSFSYKIYLFSPKLIYFPVLSFIPSCLFFFDLGFKIAFAAYGTEDDKERNSYFTEFKEPERENKLG
jgi:hypothetical protein